MNLESYLVESERTLIDKGTTLNMFHANLGILTELGETLDVFKKNIYYGKEIDTVNLREELGDLTWYIAIPIREYLLHINLLPKPLNYKRYCKDKYKIKLINRFKKEVIKYANMVDSYTGVISPNTNNLECSANKVLNVLMAVGACFDFTLEDIFQTNINKLTLRFPGKFTEEKALNRDLINERKILES